MSFAFLMKTASCACQASAGSYKNNINQASAGQPRRSRCSVAKTLSVIPAKAGIHAALDSSTNLVLGDAPMDSGFRRNDGGGMGRPRHE
ncbi:hypothetical protein [Ottowia testudinis]|uniref:Uncharacterized protein n=1 Tax=Ottowia testudinis TaxID=2816950 RepID=A0A975CJ25_9BURK|nr:hypothetical protein [Ottowia testudinis]QTD45892.1 hypothetical protein J1M35_02960 [Ottowia testudinis]